MEQMRLELAADGIDVHFVALNMLSADNDDDRKKLTDRCSFTVWQDLETINASGYHHRGTKDDIYVYDADGKLADYFSIFAERESNLSTDEGYANLKQAVLDAL